MAEAPSPYAPGIISSERSPPRAPARPVVLLVAMFVTTALMAGLRETWRWQQDPDVPIRRFNLFSTLLSAPGLLTLLWAYLVDRVALFGSRREGYLMLAALVMAGLWAAIAVGQDYPKAWTVAALPFGVASLLARAAVIGGLAEIGRRRAATGRLAAANVALGDLAQFAAPWAIVSLAEISMWAAAGAAVGLALAVVLLIVTLADDDAAPPAAPPEAVVGIPTFLRSRAFWALLPVLICAGAANVPDVLISLRRASHAAAADGGEMREWLRGALLIGVPVGYALLCRRVRLRNMLRLSLLIQALALVACGRLLASGGDRPLDGAIVLFTISDGLVGIAVLDLALRAAPPGREAFGAMFLLAVEGVTRSFSGMAAIPLARVESVSLAQAAVPVAWFGAGAAIAGVLATSLVPDAIAGTSDSRVVGSPP